MCDEEIRTGASGILGTAKNEYNRTTGECYNTKKLCDIKGVNYRSDMPPSEMAYLTDHSLPSCYVSDDMLACENILSSTVCRALASGMIGEYITYGLEYGLEQFQAGMMEGAAVIGGGLATASSGAQSLTTLEMNTGSAFGMHRLKVWLLQLVKHMET